MPRTSGVMSLPAGNPVTANTPISSTWANSTLADIASEITNSLPRDGSAPMTQALKLADGASSAPSLTFNGDAATGIYKPSNGVLGFSTSGLERARIDGSGNLSLGNTISTGDRRLTISSASTNSSSLRFYQTGISEMWLGQQSGSAGLAFGTGADYGTEFMRLSTSGNLGIGLTNPAFPLHIYRNSTGTYGSAYIESGVNAQYAPRLTLSDNRSGQSGRNWSISSGGATTGGLVIQDDTAGTYRAVFDSSGQFGIGTNAPGALLDVGANSGQKIARINGGGSNAGDGAALYLKTGSITHGVGNLSSITGGAYSSDLAIYTSSGNTLFYNGGSERVRIDASGNVGIGTNNPSGWNATLAVAKTSGTNQISVVNGGNTVSDLSALNAYANSYSTNIQQYGNGPGYLYSNGTSLYIGTTSNSSVAFISNNTERARLTNDGKFGFGSATPAARVHAVATGFFVPSSASISFAACLTEGSYGGGYLMKDGANYLGTYSVSGQYNIGLGTASGLQTAFTVASTNQSIVNPSATGYGQIAINGANGNDRGVMVQTTGVARWHIGANSEGENTGFNVGSNLSILRYSDSGTYLNTPFKIARDTGVVYTSIENTTSGTYRAYGSRVFANFNGTGSVGANQTIRSSGGVTSIYKNATGDYTINFSESQYDSNYSLVGTASGGSNGSAALNAFVLGEHWTSGAATLRSTTQIRVVVIDNNSDSAQEATSINFAIFR